MKTNLNDYLLQLLHQALTGQAHQMAPSEEEWAELYDMAWQQSLEGVLWPVVSQSQIPWELKMQWAYEADSIRQMNAEQDLKAAQLTQLFAKHGRQSAILKGQANARLYPDPAARQPGDIDIWVSGGRKSVVRLLKELGMMDGAETSYHHVHLPPSEDDIVVEVHFRPSSGNMNPLTNRRLQRWLEGEIQSLTTTEQGFCVPTIRFALVMQLAHIQRHLFSSGIGLRQVCDYYYLLRQASAADRQHVAMLLSPFGLHHSAGALMWVLGQVAQMKPTLMLCQPDPKRGEQMLGEILAGGNFGHHAERQQYGTWRWFLENRHRRMQLMKFDFCEMFWVEVNYWVRIVTRLPERIRNGKLSLRGRA